jgi:NMD protein affecting ribosome stability and mRNA decay
MICEKCGKRFKILFWSMCGCKVKENEECKHKDAEQKKVCNECGEEIGDW